jgi:hypothetical protein
MRWERLFADLAAEIESSQLAELEAEVADRTRRELARLRLVDRLRPSIGNQISVTCLGALDFVGRLADVGADWILVDAENREVLIPLAGVTSVTVSGRRASEPGSEGVVAGRLTLAYALRGLARDRSQVQCFLPGGTAVLGRLDRVGADFVEIKYAQEEERGRSAVAERWRVTPIAALIAVRRL